MKEILYERYRTRNNARIKPEKKSASGRDTGNHNNDTFSAFTR
jgi:hypothetical protein